MPVMPPSGHTASTAVNHPNTKTKLPKEPLVKKSSSSKFNDYAGAIERGVGQTVKVVDPKFW